MAGDRRRRRLIITTAVTVGVVVTSIALVDSGTSPDTGPEQIAFGSSWS